MALNLLTLTTNKGSPVSVNPAHVVSVTEEDGTSKIVLSTGETLLVKDSHKFIVQRCNFRAPDGFF